MLEAHVRCCTWGKLDGRCTDLQTKEHNSRALMNGDTWMSALQHVGEKTKKTKRRNPRYAKNQKLHNLVAIA